jgi:23S rRNA pseudouridine1911/1915/1917 synthase
MPMPISLLEIKLKTGRFHQIRAELAHIGHPIIGDVKYGSKTTFPDHHIALSATSLSFTTATGDEEKTLIVPILLAPPL